LKQVALQPPGGSSKPLGRLAPPLWGRLPALTAELTATLVRPAETLRSRIAHALHSDYGANGATRDPRAALTFAEADLAMIRSADVQWQIRSQAFHCSCARPARQLSSAVRVRHEVVQVAVGAATSSEFTAMLQDSTRRSAAGILPRRASSGKPFPLGRWRGAKPSGQKYPSSLYGMATKSREDALYRTVQ